MYPDALATDAAADFYVTDLETHSITKYRGLSSTAPPLPPLSSSSSTGTNSNSNSGAISSTSACDSSGSRVLSFPGFNAAGVALDSSGDIYIADSSHRRVVKLSSLAIQLATFTTSNPSLSFPVDVTLDSSRNMYIADETNNRVVKLSPAGTQLAIFNTCNPSLYYPCQVALDALGNVYIADQYNNRIIKLSSTGNQLAIFNTSYSLLSDPSAVALDSSGNVYVANFGNNSVVVFFLSTSCGNNNALSSSSGVPVNDATIRKCDSTYIIIQLVTMVSTMFIVAVLI